MFIFSVLLKQMNSENILLYHRFGKLKSLLYQKIEIVSKEVEIPTVPGNWNCTQRKLKSLLYQEIEIVQRKLEFLLYPHWNCIQGSWNSYYTSKLKLYPKEVEIPTVPGNWNCPKEVGIPTVPGNWSCIPKEVESWNGIRKEVEIPTVPVIRCTIMYYMTEYCQVLPKGSWICFAGSLPYCWLLRW